MRKIRSGFGRVIMVVMFLCAAAATAADLPTVGGKKIVAAVNGETITLDEFRRAIDTVHEGVGENAAGGKRNYAELLQRLINGRLILQESRNIGLDTLPEVRETVAAFQSQFMRKTLLARQVKDVRADEREVEKAYRESVREVKVRSYLFAKEEEARQAEAEIRSGADFDNVMKRMVAEGKAKGNEGAEYVKGKDLLPEVSETIAKLEEGGVSPVLKIPAGTNAEPGHAILKLEETRYPENAEAKALARRQVLKEARLAAINKYVESLKKKYVKVHKKTLKGLDYEAAKPGIGKLLADRRIVAKIRDEEPVRVADLSRAVQGKFYHGVPQGGATSRKVNRHLPEVLNELVTTRILTKEALRKKIDKTPECREGVKEFEEDVLFGTFVAKVINPDVKPVEAAISRYYEAHLEDFTAPGMIRGEELVFAGREDAADALEKLRKGADFRWLKANAPGQVEEKSRRRVFPAEDAFVSLQDLPGGGAEAVAGAAAGEYRLIATPEGQHLVLHILDVVPAKPYPIDAVRGTIEGRLFREGQQRSVEEWAGKLRAASDIRIHATDRELETIFDPAGGAAGKP